MVFTMVLLCNDGSIASDWKLRFLFKILIIQLVNVLLTFYSFTLSSWHHGVVWEDNFTSSRNKDGKMTSGWTSASACSKVLKIQLVII